MNGTRAIFWYLCSTTVLIVLTRAEVDTKGPERTMKGSETNGTIELNIFKGVRLTLRNDELSVALRTFDLFNDDDTEGNVRSQDEEESKKNPFKKMGTMLMMVPFAMQLMSLPGAIATIKLSLLRSIFMGKLAILMMIYNAIRESRNTQVMVVQHPQHHQHYYYDYHRPDDDDKWWWR